MLRKRNTSLTAIERAERMTGIRRADDFSDFDVYIICISTHAPNDMFSPNIEGTSKKVFDILSHRLYVVHAPHRWFALEEKEHGVNQLRVIGGVYDCCLRVGMQFYNSGTPDKGEPRHYYASCV